MVDTHTLEQDGFCWSRALLEGQALDGLRGAIDSGQRPGKRIDRTTFRQALPFIEPVIAIAREILPGCQPVRAITFNKTPETNWSIGWHQDRIIAVENKHDIAGYTNWTKKAGVWNCEPPVEILRQMVFARIHVDVSDADNGCLEVVRGSHAKGRILESDILNEVSASKIGACAAEAGDVLFGKALLLHRSMPSINKTQRLALRVDFTNAKLPDPLNWARL